MQARLKPGLSCPKGPPPDAVHMSVSLTWLSCLLLSSPAAASTAATPPVTGKSLSRCRRRHSLLAVPALGAPQHALQPEAGCCAATCPVVG